MKHEIEIDGLPDGWKPAGNAVVMETYPSDPGKQHAICRLNIEKIQPRRIVLEETGEETNMTQFINTGDVQLHIQGGNLWRVVNEDEK